jgi:hypothetical protein
MSLDFRIFDFRDPHNPITSFLADHFPNVIPVRRDWSFRTAGASTLRPVGVSNPPHHTIGTAVDYRVRYYFRATSPEKLDASVGVAYGAPLSNAAQKRWQKLASDFFESLKIFLKRARPARRRLDPRQDRELCRYCYILALYEELHRAALRNRASPLFSLPRKATPEDLFELAHAAWVDDLCQMSYLFYERCVALLSKPVVLNPDFGGTGYASGIEADLIVDRCLIDIKTTISPKWRLEWLYQLLIYVLLDYHDRYRMDSVGIYLARQGMLVTWPLSSLLGTLTWPASLTLPELREYFRHVLIEHNADCSPSGASRLGIPPKIY